MVLPPAAKSVHSKDQEGPIAVIYFHGLGHHASDLPRSNSWKLRSE